MSDEQDQRPLAKVYEIRAKGNKVSSPSYTQHQEGFYRAQEMLVDVLKRLPNRDALPAQDADSITDGHPRPQH